MIEHIVLFKLWCLQVTVMISSSGYDSKLYKLLCELPEAQDYYSRGVSSVDAAREIVDFFNEKRKEMA